MHLRYPGAGTRRLIWALAAALPLAACAVGPPPGYPTSVDYGYSASDYGNAYAPEYGYAYVPPEYGYGYAPDLFAYPAYAYAPLSVGIGFGFGWGGGWDGGWHRHHDRRDFRDRRHFADGSRFPRGLQYRGAFGHRGGSGHHPVAAGGGELRSGGAHLGRGFAGTGGGGLRGGHASRGHS